MVRVNGSADWHKLDAFQNSHTAQATDSFSNCSFDPADPNRRFGPSSTCYPEFVFSHLGDTDAPFDAERIGRADGPGLPGSLGPGTWVESKFDLSRYRGRSIFIRLLVTTLKASDMATWQDFLMFNPNPVDDGWYIDDIRVTETLGAATPTPALDDATPPFVPDSDADGVADACDCAPSDASAFAVPGELTGLELGADKQTLSWSSPPASGSGTLQELLRGTLSELPVGAGASETCVASGLVTSAAVDPSNPADGAAFWHLVRARNACAAGSYGLRSDLSERTSQGCP